MQQNIRQPIWTHHVLGNLRLEGDHAVITVRQAYSRMQLVNGKLRKVETSVTQDETWMRTAGRVEAALRREREGHGVVRRRQAGRAGQSLTTKTLRRTSRRPGHRSRNEGPAQAAGGAAARRRSDRALRNSIAIGSSESPMMAMITSEKLFATTGRLPNQ